MTTANETRTLRMLANALHKCGGDRLAADILDALLSCWDDQDEIGLSDDETDVATALFDYLARFPTAVTLAQEGTSTALDD